MWSILLRPACGLSDNQALCRGQAFCLTSKCSCIACRHTLCLTSDAVEQFLRPGQHRLWLNSLLGQANLND